MAREKAGIVTDAERRAATIQDGDKAAMERIGLSLVQRTGFRAQRAAVSAWLAGNDPARAVHDVLYRELLPVIRDSMVAGHVSGLRRSALESKRDKTIAAGAIDFVRGGMSPIYWRSIGSMLSLANLSEGKFEAIQEQYGQEASKVLVGVDRVVGQKLSRTVATLTESGAHIREGRKQLAEAFESLGVTPRNSFTLEALFRTQTAIAYSAGKWGAEQSPEIQEILWGYKYVTVGDDRVRPEHAGYDGVALPKDDGFWASNTPPNGWACRCTTIPLFTPVPVFEPRTVIVDGRDVAPVTDPGFAVSFGRVLGTSA
jgi:SPP1 gp7 family putative phage head morphogenesis protein